MHKNNKVQPKVITSPHYHSVMLNYNCHLQIVEIIRQHAKDVHNRVLEPAR